MSVLLRIVSLPSFLSSFLSFFLAPFFVPYGIRVYTLREKNFSFFAAFVSATEARRDDSPAILVTFSHPVSVKTVSLLSSLSSLFSLYRINLPSRQLDIFHAFVAIVRVKTYIVYIYIYIYSISCLRYRSTYLG